MLSRGQKLADGIREEDAVDLVLEPGDVSVHHTLTVHSSDTNRSDGWRIGIGISTTRRLPAGCALGILS